MGGGSDHVVGGAMGAGGGAVHCLLLCSPWAARGRTGASRWGCGPAEQPMGWGGCSQPTAGQQQFRQKHLDGCKRSSYSDGQNVSCVTAALGISCWVLLCTDPRAAPRVKGIFPALSPAVQHCSILGAQCFPWGIIGSASPLSALIATCVVSRQRGRGPAVLFCSIFGG